MKIEDGVMVIKESDGVDMRNRCESNPKNEPHSCPYAEEIGGNDDPEYCTCCDDCRHECCMDI